MLKIRRPLGRLIFNMGITIPCKTVFLIETALWTCSSLSLQMSQHLSVLWTSADTVMTTQSYTQSRKTKIMPMVNWSTKYLHHHKLCWLSIAKLSALLFLSFIDLLVTCHHCFVELFWDQNQLSLLMFPIPSTYLAPWRFILSVWKSNNPVILYKTCWMIILRACHMYSNFTCFDN